MNIELMKILQAPSTGALEGLSPREKPRLMKLLQSIGPDDLEGLLGPLKKEGVGRAIRVLEESSIVEILQALDKKTRMELWESMEEEELVEVWSRCLYMRYKNDE